MTRTHQVRQELLSEGYALLDAERESRYFADQRLYMFFSVVTMIFSLTAGATLLMATPIGWTVGLFLLVSSLTALMGMIQDTVCSQAGIQDAGGQSCDWVR